MPSRIAPILVAACGNPDAADDAFGPNVIAALSGTNSSPPCKQGGDKEGGDPSDFHNDLPPQNADVQALNLGQNPSSLLDSLPGREMLILLDAAMSQDAFKKPALIELHWPADRHAIESLQKPHSTHGFSIATQLDLAESLGWLPPSVYLLLAPVQTVALGAKPSDSSRLAVKLAVERIKDLLASRLPAR